MRMKIRSKHILLAALLAAAAVCAAVLGVLAGNPALAQPAAHPGPAEGPLAGPAACTCSRATPVGQEGQISHCQCGGLQCVALLGGRSSPSLAPALACVR